MKLTLSIDSPLPPETWLASVELEGGGHETIRVADGWFEGEMPARPLRVTCSTAAAGAHSAAPRASTTSRPSAPPPAGRLPVDVVQLFGDGVPVPADGRLELQLLWLFPCEGAAPKVGEDKRFGSFEHTLCAELVGKDERGRPLRFHGIDAHFDAAWKLDVGGKRLTFGTVIAMAGDYYAHLDDRAVADFAWAWPEMAGAAGWLAGDYRATTLAGDDMVAVSALDEHIHKEGPGAGAGILTQAALAIKSDYPLRRYLALASQNICHFACQNSSYSARGNPALALYRAYHLRALAEARAAGEAGDRDGLDAALVVEAFGCHFLTDLFASGHIRVPRGVLGRRFGITRGALVMSKRFHDEDNREGLWVRPLRFQGEKRPVWRAFGDDWFSIDDAAIHRAQVQESVRRSAAEVFAAYCAARKEADLPELPAGEDLVAVPLAPGEAPDLASDASPGGGALSHFPPNRPPLYKVLDDGRVAERGHRDVYVTLEQPDVVPAPEVMVP
jgi:hypothetical protein